MYNVGSDGTILAVFLIVIMCIFYLAVLGLCIASYVMSSLSLYKIANRRQINNPWLVWLPIGNYWIIGGLADEYVGHFGQKKKWRKLLMILFLAFIGIYVFFYVGFFIAVITALINFDEFGETMVGVVGFFVAMFAFLIIIFGLAVAWSVCYYICLYKIYKSTIPEKATLYLVLSIFIPFALAVCLFKCRDKGYSIPPANYGNQNPTYYPQNYR